MTNHDSELPKDVCQFRSIYGELCGEPKVSIFHEHDELCMQGHEPSWGCHPFADPAPVDQVNSRSQQRRIAAMKGQPAHTFGAPVDQREPMTDGTVKERVALLERLVSEAHGAIADIGLGERHKDALDDESRAVFRAIYGGEGRALKAEAALASSAALQCPQCDSRERRKLNDKCQSKPYQPIHLKQYHPWHDAVPAVGTATPQISHDRARQLLKIGTEKDEHYVELCQYVEQQRAATSQSATAAPSTLEQIKTMIPEWFDQQNGWNTNTAVAFTLAVLNDFKRRQRTLLLSCTVCHHPMRFHDDPADGSHWCLACVSRANEKRAAEYLEALSTLVKILLKLSEIDDGVMYFNGRYCGELQEPLSRAEAAIAAKDARNNTVRSSKENPRTGRG